MVAVVKIYAEKIRMMKSLLFLIILAISGGNNAAYFNLKQPYDAQAETDKIQVFCLSQKGLTEVKSAIDRDDPLIKASFNKLIDQAEKALVAGPFSVMQKTKVPPSGDKHDYMSVPPYAGTGDGLTNPVWWLDYDRVPLEKLTQSVETMALAYHFTGKQKYAERAVFLLRVWFLNPDTKMNPDLEFAQSRIWVGVIDTRFLSRIIDGIGLLQPSGAWTNEDQEGMVKWCREFLANVQDRVDERHEHSGHNISSWYHVQIASMALFTGNLELARDLLERTKARMDTALNSMGGFKKELHRTRSLSYSCFHIYALFNLASMGELVDMDLWNYRTKDGRGLELALQYLSRYAGVENKKQWPYEEIDGTRGDWWDPYYDMLPSVLYHAADIYNNEHFHAGMEQILGDRLDQSRIQIMCGIPVRWFETIDHERSIAGPTAVPGLNLSGSKNCEHQNRPSEYLQIQEENLLLSTE